MSAASACASGSGPVAMMVIPSSVIIIGAGIVGLAVGLEFMQRYPDADLTILEKEDDVARHQTGHNRGVIHSGIYYKQDR